MLPQHSALSNTLARRTRKSASGTKVPRGKPWGLGQQYVKDKPGQSDAMMQLLGTRRELALLRFAEGDTDAGREEMQKVVSEFDAIANVERAVKRRSGNALLFKSDLATQLLFSRQLDESLKLFTAVAEGQQKMVDEDPQKLQFREGLAGTLYGLATAQQRQRR